MSTKSSCYFCGIALAIIAGCHSKQDGKQIIDVQFSSDHPETVTRFTLDGAELLRLQGTTYKKKVNLFYSGISDGGEVQQVLPGMKSITKMQRSAPTRDLRLEDDDAINGIIAEVLAPDGWVEVQIDQTQGSEKKPWMVTATRMNADGTEMSYGEIFCDNRDGQDSQLSIGEMLVKIDQGYAGILDIALPTNPDATPVRLDGQEIGYLKLPVPPVQMFGDKLDSLQRMYLQGDSRFICSQFLIDTSGSRSYRIRHHFYVDKSNKDVARSITLPDVKLTSKHLHAFVTKNPVHFFFLKPAADDVAGNGWDDAVSIEEK